MAFEVGLAVAVLRMGRRLYGRRSEGSSMIRLVRCNPGRWTRSRQRRCVSGGPIKAGLAGLQTEARDPENQRRMIQPMIARRNEC